jgi:hypothetical protein
MYSSKTTPSREDYRGSDRGTARFKPHAYTHRLYRLPRYRTPPSSTVMIEADDGRWDFPVISPRSRQTGLGLEYMPPLGSFSSERLYPRSWLRSPRTCGDCFELMRMRLSREDYER